MNSHAKESNDFHVLANMMVCVNEKMGNTIHHMVKSLVFQIVMKMEKVF